LVSDVGFRKSNDFHSNVVQCPNDDNDVQSNISRNAVNITIITNKLQFLTNPIMSRNLQKSPAFTFEATALVFRLVIPWHHGNTMETPTGSGFLETPTHLTEMGGITWILDDV
jgi:hypothetical protein